MGVFLARFSLQMDRFSDPVATHHCTNEAEVLPGTKTFGRGP